MRIQIASAVLLALLSALSGCGLESRKPVVQCRFPRQAAPQPGDALVAQEYGRISPVPLDAVQFTDRTLSKEIAVQSLRSQRTGTNTVRVSAQLVNCTDSSLVVGVRANFLDASHLAAEPASVWQNVVLQPRSLGLYQESSISQEVAHFILELRDAGN